MENSQNQLIGHRRFAGSAGTGYAYYRGFAVSNFFVKFGSEAGKMSIFLGLGLFNGCNKVGNQIFVVKREFVEVKIIHPDS